jgi:hypothetical protein
VRLAFSSSIASSARGRPPGTATGRPSATTSSGPRIRNSTAQVNRIDKRAFPRRRPIESFAGPISYGPLKAALIVHAKELARSRPRGVRVNL